MIWILPFIFVLVHDSSGNDSVRRYNGMDQATITSLLQGEGKTGDVITQKQYDTFVAAHQPVPVPTDLAKVQAKVDLNTVSKTDAERINAMIKYLDLDK